MKRPLVSVVIPAYNEEYYLPACLDSLIKQKTDVPYEVIVVNNASTDKTKQVAQTYKVKIIDEPRKGRGYARQTGFEHAIGDIILGTEADTVVPLNWVEHMYKSFSEKKCHAITGPMKIKELSPFKRSIINYGLQLIVELYRLFFGYTFLAGFNMGLSKELFKKVGGFDVRLNTLDEVELSARISKITPIYFIKDLPVIVSARRFKKNFWGGVGEYIKANYLFAKNQTPVFTDPR